MAPAPLGPSEDEDTTVSYVMPRCNDACTRTCPACACNRHVCTCICMYMHMYMYMVMYACIPPAAVEPLSSSQGSFCKHQASNCKWNTSSFMYMHVQHYDIITESLWKVLAHSLVKASIHEIYSQINNSSPIICIF